MKERPTVDHMADVVLGWLKDSREEDRDAFINASEDEVGSWQHSLGLKIRNEFGLWAFPWTAQLDEDKVDISPDHPDNISGRVIHEVWKRSQPDVRTS